MWRGNTADWTGVRRNLQGAFSRYLDYNVARHARKIEAAKKAHKAASEKMLKKAGKVREKGGDSYAYILKHSPETPKIVREHNSLKGATRQKSEQRVYDLIREGAFGKKVGDPKDVLKDSWKNSRELIKDERKRVFIAKQMKMRDEAYLRQEMRKRIRAGIYKKAVISSVSTLGVAGIGTGYAIERKYNNHAKMHPKKRK